MVSNIPLDPKTLLRTAKNTTQFCNLIKGGEYCDQGLQIGLKNSFRDLCEDTLLYLSQSKYLN